MTCDHMISVLFIDDLNLTCDHMISFLFIDDLNLAYHSLLPLEVHGSNYCSMKLVTNQSYQPVTVSMLRNRKYGMVGHEC